VAAYHAKLEKVATGELPIDSTADRLERVERLAGQGDVPGAEVLCREVLAVEPRNRRALEQLVILCLQGGRPQESETVLRRLMAEHPQETLYRQRLLTLLEQSGRLDDALALYRQELEAEPERNDTRYNFARLLNRAGRPDEALAEYRVCLARGIDRPEEVHSNMGILLGDLHRPAAARGAFEAALACKPAHLPALFNLALLEEEEGDWPAARALYEQALSREPLHPGALTHLAQGERITDPVAPLIRQIKRALRREGLSPLDAEQLMYSLGKAYDDCAHYDQAFDWYRQANALSQRRAGPYDPGRQERIVDDLIAHCDAQWLVDVEPVSQDPHIFICGMFRSGSTLLEQILTAHPRVTAGGEIDWFQREVKPYPEALFAPDGNRLQTWGKGYQQHIARLFPGSIRVTNKRPDNFLYLGLLAALFPAARFVNTRRDPLDNCLALYFQPLAAAQAYANELGQAAHYHRQYRRLMTHWQAQFGDRIYSLHYETLVAEPSESVSGLLTFLGLDWDDGCLEFHRQRNRVRTASVHQVREPLYSNSVGRWRHYDRYLDGLRAALG